MKNLDETIKHCIEVAEDRAGCAEDCASEHRQFAELLMELKAYRENEIETNKRISVINRLNRIAIVSRIEQAKKKDKNVGGYPYDRCIEIVNSVLIDEVETEPRMMCEED